MKTNQSSQKMTTQKRPNVRVLVHGCQNKPQPIQKGSFLDKIINPTEPTKFYTPIFLPIFKSEHYLKTLKATSSEKIYKKYENLHKQVKYIEPVPHVKPEPIINPEDEQRYLELLGPYLSKGKGVPLKYNIKIFKSLNYSQEKIKKLKKLYASRDAKNSKIWSRVVELFDIDESKVKKSKKNAEKEEVEVEEFDLGDTEDEYSEEEIEEEPFDVEEEYDEEQEDEEYVDNDYDD